MRHFTKLALLTALSLTCASLATGSTSTDYNNATMSLTASGTAGTAVGFTVPSASISIPGSQVRPGASFKVTIPVTNTTDREITVSVMAVKSGDLSGKLTVTPVKNTATIAAGAAGTLVYSFSFAEAVPGDQDIAGQSFAVTFDLSAVGTYDTAQDKTF